MKKQLIEIAPRLRIIRSLLRISQRDFAQRLQISLSHYSKLESGIGGISDALLLAIAAEAQVDLEWLKTGAGNAPSLPAKTIKLPRSNPLSLEQVEQIITFTENEEIQYLAEKLAHMTEIPRSRALATLAREYLKMPPK
ncbi:MAG: helix-turn-helix transcriptional regulator [Lentisphaeria bacterium]